eukprot:352126-Chlamydomonas_euryale.AAC.2
MQLHNAAQLVYGSRLARTPDELMCEYAQLHCPMPCQPCLHGESGCAFECCCQSRHMTETLLAKVLDDDMEGDHLCQENFRHMNQEWQSYLHRRFRQCNLSTTSQHVVLIITGTSKNNTFKTE